MLGKRPATIELPPSATPATIAAYTPQFPPLNPRLLDLYDVVHDRLELIRLNMNARRLREDRPFGHSAYFGDDPARHGLAGGRSRLRRGGGMVPSAQSLPVYVPCPEGAGICRPGPQELGAALLAAFEKGDAEYLASLRARHERELLGLMIDAKKDQWREADWQVEALQKTKTVARPISATSPALIQNGLIDDEIGYEAMIGVSTDAAGGEQHHRGDRRGAEARPRLLRSALPDSAVPR